MPRQAVELRGEDRLIGAVVGRWILNWVLSPMTRAATSLSGGPMQPMPVRAFSVGPPLRSSSYDAFAVVAVMPHERRRADCKQCFRRYCHVLFLVYLIEDMLCRFLAEAASALEPEKSFSRVASRGANADLTENDGVKGHCDP